MNGNCNPRTSSRPVVPRRKRTIAAFFDYVSPFSGGYQAEIRKQLDQNCRAHDLNFLSVYGRAIEERNPKSAAYNAIYELFEHGSVDGIIVLSTTLSTHCGVDGLAQFLRRFRGVPLCSLGIAIPDIPSVIVDNRQGMDAIMEHVLGEHGARRVAFLEGATTSPEAQARFDVYRAALNRYDIAYDPALVACGSFQWTLGNRAMEELLERDVRIDAVVAANDLMALGALEALSKRGYRVPTDLLITGFDDIPESLTMNPPLTTVAQPYEAMAERAMHSILMQLDGQNVPPVDPLPARLVTRRSCGCRDLADRGADATHSSHSTCDLADSWNEACERITKDRQVRQPDSPAMADATASSMIAIGERISVTLDVASFQQALTEVLPQTGIPTVFLSRFVEGNPAELESLVALVDGQPVAGSGRPFNTRALFPPGAFPANRRYSLYVFPMVYNTERLGVAVFESRKSIYGYQMVRDQIATALKAVSLHQEVREQTILRDRSAQEQERLATAKRLRALSVLAGGVAHDLNNVLGPLAALPDIMIRVLDRPELSPDATLELQEDLRSIKSASLRAAQTIKDLLTMSRQGRTTKEPLDLGRVVKVCMSGDSLDSIQRLNGAVEISCQVPDSPLVVRASKSHVERAIANLARNAVEAIRGSGQVVVRLTSRKISDPVTGFEEVTPGHYAILSVSDNGSGIAAPDRGRIFEPFFSQKPLDEQSGSGLGLAIVHSVVKEHEGFIDVTSKLGSGTTFTLYFPVTNEVVAGEQASTTLHRGTAKLLVLDDDRTQLRTCRRVLSHLGYEVEIMSNAQQVCDRFAEASASGKCPYDLVILDMMLNQALDGLDVYQKIQEYFPAQRGIMVSGYAALERAEAAISKGLCWVVKPYTAEVLANAVAAALSDHPSLRLQSLSSAPPVST